MYYYIVIIQVTTIPNPFPIPKFRIATENNLAKKILLDTDRKYMVQTLTTMMMSYKQAPAMSDCSIVAKSLIGEYPFLKDDDGDGEVSAAVANNIKQIIITFVLAFMEVVSLLSFPQY